MDVAEWLHRTTTGEVMTESVVTLSADEPLSQAVHRLLDECISGAPVVDESGVCVGVLSLADLARAEDDATDELATLTDTDFFRSHLVLPTSVHAERFEAIRDRLQPAGDRTVERYMTSDLVTVGEEATLQSVVQSMVDAHLHRVLVTGPGKRLLGLISSTDILAALFQVGLRAELAGDEIR